MTEPIHSPPHAHGDQVVHMPGHAEAHAPAASHVHQTRVRAGQLPARSVLAWPAWLRVAAVMPIVIALWLAVLWANEGIGLW